MIQRGNDMIETLKSLTQGQAEVKNAIEQFATEEDKQSEDYQKLTEELAEIESDLKNLTNDKDAEEIQKLDEIQTYISQLQQMIDDEDTSEEMKERAERQIFLIKSSYTFEIFNELKPTQSSSTLRANFMRLRKDAERKLERNEHFMFHSVMGLEKKIKKVLPEHLKIEAVTVASFIYAFINTASLQPDGHSMFIFFLIKNINKMDSGIEFPEKEALVENLVKLAEHLV
jgi:chromosome segregation ATPase